MGPYDEESPKAIKQRSAIVGKLVSYYWLSAPSHDGMAPEDARIGWAAWQAVEAMLKIPTVRALLVVTLATAATSESKRAYLAAGPLEELLEHALPEDLAILTDALNNPYLQDMLTRVNPPESPRSLAWLEEHSRK